MESDFPAPGAEPLAPERCPFCNSGMRVKPECSDRDGIRHDRLCFGCGRRWGSRAHGLVEIPLSPAPSSPGPEAIRYRKRPVVIDAARFDGTEDSFFTVCKALGAIAGTDIYPGSSRDGGRATLEIRTLEGRMRAEPGDWIIRGIKGELYPCKPDIFEATYERA